ncbi:phage tail tape measure protein [Salininema proteolyticum]|uniref:Phage tail tape measure protein n=1 Tax=Salininema proteolyticum TaxID=1607685 RepID=A0ABV8TX12_9ACTN
MAVEVAVGYVRLIPTTKGFAREAEVGLSGALPQAAERASDKAGAAGAKRFGRAFQSALTLGAIFGGAQLLSDGFAEAVSQADLPGQLSNQFGLGTAAAREAGETASKVYSDGFGTNLAEVGNTVGNLSRALSELGTGEDIDRLTRQAQGLASTFGEDVRDVVTSATQLVRNGMSPSMEDAFDVITRGFQTGGDQGRDFLDTVTEYSGQFSQLGLDATASFGLVNQALQAGARNSDFVADAFKEFAIRAVDGSKSTASGFESIGLKAEDMAAKIGAGGETAEDALQLTLDSLRAIEDPVLRDQAAVELFGTKAEDLGDALYALDPAAAAAEGGLGDVDGAAQGTADTMENSLGQQLAETQRELKTGLGQSLVDIAPLLTGLLDGIRPLLPILTPLAIALGVVAAAQWAWNIAMYANPIFLVIGLIVGLIAVFVLLWNKSEGFRDFWIGLWEAISGAAVAAAKWIADIASALWSGIVAGAEWLRDKAVGAWNAVSSGASSALDWAGRKWQSFKDNVSDIVSDIKSFLSDIWSGVSSGAKSALNGAIGLINGAVDGINWLIDGANKLPSVSIPHVPYIPYLAEGGIVSSATLAVVGEGSEPEAVMPLSRLENMLDLNTTSPVAAAGPTVEIVAGDRHLLEWLRSTVRTHGGGSVQATLGQPGRA